LAVAACLALFVFGRVTSRFQEATIASTADVDPNFSDGRIANAQLSLFTPRQVTVGHSELVYLVVNVSHTNLNLGLRAELSATNAEITSIKDDKTIWLGLMKMPDIETYEWAIKAKAPGKIAVVSRIHFYNDRLDVPIREFVAEEPSNQSTEAVSENAVDLLWIWNNSEKLAAIIAIVATLFAITATFKAQAVESAMLLRERNDEYARNAATIRKRSPRK
jgi:hypothetical protein